MDESPVGARLLSLSNRSSARQRTIVKVWIIVWVLY